MEDSKPQDTRPRGPRLYHKKSRTGCLRCKQRRVKCDELRPSCGSCTRHAVECVYTNQASGPANAQSQAGPAGLDDHQVLAVPAVKPESPANLEPATVANVHPSFSPGPTPTTMEISPHSSAIYPSPSSSHQASHVDDNDPDISLPEGHWRRLWELRLLHNSQTRLHADLASGQLPEVVHVWLVEEPQLALKMAQKYGRCSLLYISFAHSALHLWSVSEDPQERDELIQLQRTYHIMCSKEQRRDVDELSTAHTKFLDYVCFTALKILAHSLALVQTLSTDPWDPPVQWLHMGHGAGQIFQRAASLIVSAKQPYESTIGRYLNTPPMLNYAEDTILSDHTRLLWLLENPFPPSSIEAQTDQELVDEHTRTVYQKTLGYICSVLRAKEGGEAEYAIIRRLGAFAVWVPIEFSKFVEEKRPRALVILAHFMSLWLPYEHIWILGKSGERQIRCIYKQLPMGWTRKLDDLFAQFPHPVAR
ncbi:hypothetical protein F5Y18DRAFT_206260 [Xylariaceae sp. FL1019]|nr:hypothetical protein F5Y18DRAFT_206260 [Xylariaceae sp. FL1019]